MLLRTTLIISTLVVPLASDRAACDDHFNFKLDPADDRLLPVRVDGRWGYCDTLGRLAIEPKFDWAQDFSEGLALVAHDKKLVYIDRSGQNAIEPPFTHDHSPFAGGYAKGSIGLEFRFIDRNGRLLQPFFAAAGNFSDGLAAVCIDPSRFQGPANADKPDYILSGKWGFIDAPGKMAIEPTFTAVAEFRDGLAPVYVGGKNLMCTGLCEGKWGYVDRHGELVIRPQFARAHSFSEGLAVVSFDGKETGYIDRTGKVVISPRAFSFAGRFQDGVARIRGSRDLVSPGWKDFGYIDKSGQIFTHPNFAQSDDFSEGVAAARQKPTWDVASRQWIQGPFGYVDKQGNWEIEPRFTQAKSFVGGVARVGTESGTGYINRDGRYIWHPTK